MSAQVDIHQRCVTSFAETSISIARHIAENVAFRIEDDAGDRGKLNAMAIDPANIYSKRTPPVIIINIGQSPAKTR
jgi:hypothetical protein